MLPLEDISVVALEQAVAAPFATRQLADLGARVIKIERPEGGDFAREYDDSVNGLSSYFVWLNRCKESLTLDLKRPEAKDVLHRLLERADVFIHNLAPGAVGRLGFQTAALRASYPRMVICEISGYGSTGPYRDKKAYDLLVQSEVGLVSITGTPETPSRVGISVADIAAGMYAYSGILTALLTRSKTGAGSAVEVSLFDALSEWMGSAMYYAGYGHLAPPRSGPNHATIAPYGPFFSHCGKSVYLGIQNEREWIRFCLCVLKKPALASDLRFDSNAKRVQNRASLHEAIEQVFGGLTAGEIIDRLDAARIANGRMNTMEEYLDHPQLADRGRWQTVDSPVGPVRALLPPVMLEGVVPVMGPIPVLGQHTDSILQEIGFDCQTIRAWRAEGVI